MTHPHQQNPVALITGAARRIGAAIATYLHHHQFDVIIHYNKSKKEALTLTQKLNTNRSHSAYSLCVDLSQKNAADQMLDQMLRHTQHIHLLVNNASIFKQTVLKNLDADWDKMFQVNVKTPYALSSAFLPYLQATQGSIVNITDLHSEKPLKDYPTYCQTKAALTMQTKALALEFAPLVRVNGVAPGAIDWPEGENTLSEMQQQKIVAKTPLQKHGRPEYIAQAVYLLAQNPFITGEIIHVDGGRHCI